MYRQSKKIGFVELFNHGKFYWICVVITTLLCYGFTLTNLSISPDSELMEGFFHGFGLLTQGRWSFVPLIYIFDTYHLLPFWRDFIALNLMVVGLTIFCGLYKKYSNDRFDDRSAAIFTCVAISFPWIAHLFIFAPATVEIGLLITFAGVSLFFASKWIIDRGYLFYAVAGAISLGYALSAYETAMIFFLTGGFSLVMIHSIFSPNKSEVKLSQGLLMSVKLLGVALAGVFVWRMVASVLLSIYGRSYSNYIGGYIGYNTDSIFAFIVSFLRFAGIFIHQMVLGFGIRSSSELLIWLASMTIIFIGLVLAIAMKRPSILLAGVLTVGSAYGIILVTGNTNQLMRILLTFSVLIAFCFSLLFTVLRNFEFKKIAARYFVGFVAILIVFVQSREMNQIFYLDYQRYQYEVGILHRIDQDLFGFDRTKPVIFIGTVYQPFIQNEVVGGLLFNWGRPGGIHTLFSGESARIPSFFRHHGFPIQSIPDYELDFDELRLQVVGMANFPDQGYIKEFENHIIVKLGPSILDHTGVVTLYNPQDLEDNPGVWFSLDFIEIIGSYLSISGWALIHGEDIERFNTHILLKDNQGKYFKMPTVNVRRENVTRYFYRHGYENFNFTMSGWHATANAGGLELPLEYYEIIILYRNNSRNILVNTGRYVEVQLRR